MSSKATYITPEPLDWHVTGNAGTDDTVNFAGTLDNEGYEIRTNNVGRIHVTEDGDTSIGHTDPHAVLDHKGDYVRRFNDGGDIPNFAASGGNIATQAIIDDNSSLRMVQSTAGINRTIPAPSDTTPGKRLTLANAGTVPIQIDRAMIPPQSAAEFVWDGTQWLSFMPTVACREQVTFLSTDQNITSTFQMNPMTTETAWIRSQIGNTVTVNVQAVATGSCPGDITLKRIDGVNTGNVWITFANTIDGANNNRIELRPTTSFGIETGESVTLRWDRTALVWRIV